MICPRCGSTNVTHQAFQEQSSSTTVSKTTSKYKEKGHGCLWWLLIGWWWWIVDILLWTFFFVPRLLAKLFKRKKYVGKSTTVSKTSNEYAYKTVHICGDCGHCWKVDDPAALIKH